MYQGHFIYSTDIFFLTTFPCKENLLTCSCFCTKMHIAADCGLNVSCHLHVSWKHVFCKCSTSHRDFLNLLWTDFLYIYLIAVFSLKIGCVLEQHMLHKSINYEQSWQIWVYFIYLIPFAIIIVWSDQETEWEKNIVCKLPLANC